MIKALAIQMSETLGFMSLMALLVCCYRMQRLATEVRIASRSPVTDFSQRKMFLVGFGLYMTGAVLRESVVLIAGLTGWDDNAVMLSTISRLIQVAGASVYVRAASLPWCGEAGWMTVLGMALAFAMVSPL